MEENGYELVYDKRYYFYFSDTSELVRIKNECTETTIICAGALNVISDLLNIVACGNCRQVFRSANFSLIDTYQVNNEIVDWFFIPDDKFGFESKRMFSDETGVYSRKNISWNLDVYNLLDNSWELINNGYHKKCIFKKEINSLSCPPNWRVGFPVTCKLKLILDRTTALNFRINYGDNQTTSFSSTSKTINITKTYQNVGEYLLRVEIPSANIVLEKRIQILNRTSIFNY